MRHPDEQQIAVYAGGDANWINAANWDTGLPTNGDNLIFGDHLSRMLQAAARNQDDRSPCVSAPRIDQSACSPAGAARDM